jgi:hypothetical protein
MKFKVGDFVQVKVHCHEEPCLKTCGFRGEVVKVSPRKTLVFVYVALDIGICGYLEEFLEPVCPLDLLAGIDNELLPVNPPELKFDGPPVC